MVARAVAATDADEATAAAAETELYRRFAPRVRLFGLKHLPDRSAADDLAQQVMLVVITRLRAGEVREPDQIGSFVLGTSRMMVAGQRRGERRRAAIVARFEPFDEATETSNDLALDSRRLAPCLAALRERERTIVLIDVLRRQVGNGNRRGARHDGWRGPRQPASRARVDTRLHRGTEGVMTNTSAPCPSFGELADYWTSRYHTG